MSKKSNLPDISHLNSADLTALIREAERLRENKLEEAKQALKDEVRARAAELGLALEDVFGGDRKRRQRSDAGKKLPVRYRGPKGEEWAGRGPTPRWLRALEQAGRKRTDYEVKG